MTIAAFTFAVFTFVNSLRLLAYVPQIAKTIKDRSGATAISFATWSLFLASYASAMGYAIENQGDWAMASVFLGNTVGCAAILLIAAWKRCLYRRLGAEEAVSGGGPSWPAPVLLRPIARMRREPMTISPRPDALSRLAQTLALWHQRARERTALLQLGEHELRDIGLTRAQAAHLAKKPLWHA